MCTLPLWNIHSHCVSPELSPIFPKIQTAYLTFQYHHFSHLILLERHPAVASQLCTNFNQSHRLFTKTQTVNPKGVQVSHTHHSLTPSHPLGSLLTPLDSWGTLRGRRTWSLGRGPAGGWCRAARSRATRTSSDLPHSTQGHCLAQFSCLLGIWASWTGSNSYLWISQSWF